MFVVLLAYSICSKMLRQAENTLSQGLINNSSYKNKLMTNDVCYLFFYFNFNNFYKGKHKGVKCTFMDFLKFCGFSITDFFFFFSE
jgi:hypothetical protein